MYRLISEMDIKSPAALPTLSFFSFQHWWSHQNESHHKYSKQQAMEDDRSDVRRSIKQTKMADAKIEGYLALEWGGGSLLAMTGHSAPNKQNLLPCSHYQHKQGSVAVFLRFEVKNGFVPPHKGQVWVVYHLNFSLAQLFEAYAIWSSYAKSWTCLS